MPGMSSLARAAVIVVALNLAGSAALAQNGPNASSQEEAPRASPPGEGVVCLWAIMVVMDQVARRCAPGKDPAFEAETRDAVLRLDRYVLDNSDIGPEGVAQFKKEQGHLDGPDSFFCTGDPADMYEAFRAKGPAMVHGLVDRAVSRPGAPTWGTCF